jgi:glycosyltransferase involved in cell wall biosynthesis
VDSIKKSHPIYHYLQSGYSKIYKFGDSDSDLTIISLEDNTSQQRINNLLVNSKKFFIYFEHITSLTNDVSNDFIQHLLSHPCFLGFITHSQNTFRYLKSINYHAFYLPIGVFNQDEQKIKHRIHFSDVLNFVFWSSWNDIHNNNFYGRGGLYADEIFSRVRRHRNCTLTIRSPVELKSAREFPESVRNINRYLLQSELFDIYTNSNLYFLPSAQAHFITIPEAMSFGLPVIGTDTWGFDENITDRHNGIVENCNQKWELCRSRDSLDYEYIEKVTNRLIHLTKEDLILLSLNALNHQISFHNADNYPTYIEDILETTNALRPIL